MGNLLPVTTHKGTLGELLVQLRLLEYGVQAAPPIKDSGNDLIAIKGEVVKFIQVKTGAVGRLPKVYHLLAHVALVYDKNGCLALDQSKIHIIQRDNKTNSRDLLTKELVDKIWG